MVLSSRRCPSRAAAAAPPHTMGAPVRRSTPAGGCTKSLGSSVWPLRKGFFAPSPRLASVWFTCEWQAASAQRTSGRVSDRAADALCVRACACAVHTCVRAWGGAQRTLVGTHGEQQVAHRGVLAQAPVGHGQRRRRHVLRSASGGCERASGRCSACSMQRSAAQFSPRRCAPSRRAAGPRPGPQARACSCSAGGSAAREPRASSFAGCVAKAQRRAQRRAAAARRTCARPPPPGSPRSGGTSWATAGTLQAHIVSDELARAQKQRTTAAQPSGGS